MSKKSGEQGRWLEHYRRALGYVWPHWRYLGLGVVAVVGVSVFYTLSVSSIVPFLTVMFARNETMGDWLYRNVAAHRAGCHFAEDDPERQGIKVLGVSQKAGGPLGALGQFDRIVSVNGRKGTQFDLYRVIAGLGEGEAARVEVAYEDGREARGEFVPRRLGWQQRAMLGLTEVVPRGRDARSKMASLSLVMGVVLLFSLAGGLSRFAHEYLIGLVGERAMLDLRTQVYAKVLRLPMGWFSQQQAGDTMSRFARDSEVVRKGIGILFEKTLREPLKAVGVVVVVLVLNWRLLLAVVVATPIAALLVVRFGRRMRRAERKALLAWGHLVDLLSEKIAGIGIVKAYHTERRERARFFREHRRLLRQQVKIARIEAATTPSLEFLGTMAVGGFVLYGGYLVFAGVLTAQGFVASVVCLGAMFDPIRKLANVNNHLQAADTAAQRVFSVMDLEAEEPVDAGQRRVRLGRLSRGIQFEDVWFSYPMRPDRPVLREVNLTVSPGEVVAIVGPNGAGKTTLCHLLMRFYQPQRGRVLFDGVDIREASLVSLRGQIGLVTQETVIFTDTVRNNIAYGCPEVGLEQVREAAQASYADDFIQQLRSEENGEVRRGYEAVISSGRLSGGQRQRLAIARAIIRDPAILIFDEATSQVDSDSELKIQRALGRILQGRTTLLIAHRFSTIAQADRIVVMDEGKIMAVGRHEALVDTCPLYRTLYERQFREVG